MSVPAPVGAATVVSSHRTVELLGGQRTQDVYEIGATTAENNVYFQFRVPVALADPGSIEMTMNAIAVQLDTLFTIPQVVGVSYVQDVNAANQLEDLVEIYVTSTDGRADDFLRWPLESVDLRVVAQPIADLVAKLDAIMAA